MVQLNVFNGDTGLQEKELQTPKTAAEKIVELLLEKLNEEQKKLLLRNLTVPDGKKVSLIYYFVSEFIKQLHSPLFSPSSTVEVTGDNLTPSSEKLNLPKIPYLLADEIKGKIRGINKALKGVAALSESSFGMHDISLRFKLDAQHDKRLHVEYHVTLSNQEKIFIPTGSVILRDINNGNFTWIPAHVAHKIKMWPLDALGNIHELLVKLTTNKIHIYNARLLDFILDKKIKNKVRIPSDWNKFGDIVALGTIYADKKGVFFRKAHWTGKGWEEGRLYTHDPLTSKIIVPYYEDGFFD